MVFSEVNMEDLEFHVLDELIAFEWCRCDVVVVGLTFHQLMIKLRHLDRSWAS